MSKTTFRILFIFSVLNITGKLNAQLVQINNNAYPESSFSPEKLISDVLIKGDCAAISNFSAIVSGFPSNQNSKNYGYFKRAPGSNFPFDEGIILSTGIANKVIPAIGSFTTGVPDPDLTDVFNFNPFIVSDACVIEFDFIPKSTDISFRYLMASNEYTGVFPCFFADSFAFLLRKKSEKAYKNIALLPDNITPVSITNVHKEVPGQCAAKNEEFFYGNDVGETNFAGRTKVFTAKASVIPNEVYHIKLVVVDYNDRNWDTAIFLEKGSFNLGLDLGEDATIANNNSVCGSEILLTSNIDANSYKWFKDGVEIPGETKQTYLANLGNGTYSCEIDDAGCQGKDQILIEFSSPPTNIPSISDLITCNSNTVDLTLKANEILNGQANTKFEILYYSDANYSNQITTPNNYTFIGTDTTIYVRKRSILAKNCISDGSFKVSILNNTTLSISGDTNVCGKETLLTANINATNYKWFKDGTEILGETKQTYLANLGNGIYTCEIDEGNCKESKDIAVKFYTAPTPVSNLQDVNVCNTKFVDLSDKALEILDGQDNSEIQVLFFTDPNYTIQRAGYNHIIANKKDRLYFIKRNILTPDCEVRGYFDINSIDASLNINGNTSVCGSKTLLTANASFSGTYKWFKDGTEISGETKQTYTANLGNGTYSCETSNGTCTIKDDISITFYTVPTTIPTISDIVSCNSSIVNLTSKENQILNGQNNTEFEVLYYSDANYTNLITNSINYTITGTNATIYVRKRNKLNINCTADGTFNVQVISNSFTISGDTNVCGTQTLLTANINAAKYKWLKDGVEISGETNQTYTANLGTGTYSCEIEQGTCKATENIDITFYTAPTTIPTISDIVSCNSNIVDLTTKENQILNGQSSSEFEVLYYSDVNYTNLINPTNYTISGTNATIYVRKRNKLNTNCTADGTFNVQVINNSFTISGDTTVCGTQTLLTANINATKYKWLKDGTEIPGETNQTYTANLGTGTYSCEIEQGSCKATETIDITFYTVPTNIPTISDIVSCNSNIVDLTTKENQILNGQSNTKFEVLYYSNVNYTNLITNPTNYTISGTNATIYVRKRNKLNTNCTADGTFNVQVINNSFTISGDTTVCGTQTLLTANINVTKYKWLKDGTEIPGETKQTYTANLGTGTYSCEIEQGTCKATETIDIEFYKVPTFIPTISDIISCNSNIVDLTTKENQILNGQSNSEFEVLYYSDVNYANLIINSTNYTITGTNATIYVRKRNKSNTNCATDSLFNIKLVSSPTPNQATNYEECDDSTSGSDSDGFFNNFILASKDSEILSGLSPSKYKISYYTSLIGAQTNSFNNLIDKNTPYTNIKPYEQTIYVRVENILNKTCFTISEPNSVTFKPFKLIVKKLPEIINNSLQVIQCSSNRNSKVNIDLTQKQSLISKGHLQQSFKYYTSKIDAETDTNVIVDPSNYATNTNNIIWVRTINSNGCYRISVINIIISFTNDVIYNDKPTTCDDFLDANGNNTINNNDSDGIANFDLSKTIENIKLNFPVTQQQNLDILLFESENDRNNMINPISNIVNYRNSNLPAITPQKIYVKVINNKNNNCVEYGQFTIQVYSLPQFSVTTPQIICSNQTTIIEAENPNENYRYEWRKNNVLISGQNTERLNITQEGTYKVTAINTKTLCKRSRAIVVNESAPPTLTLQNISIVENSDNNTISINNNLGLGTYEFALLNQDKTIERNFQDIPLFENLSGGIYTILTRDKNNCGETQLEVSILEFPKFFTPNNDGVNDLWNVKGVNQKFYSKNIIYIYDRYGKVIYKLTANQQGWDGTYNGKPLSSNDYWFTIHLTDINGNKSIKKGNFSLLRK